jgi:hypothetical protein
VLPELDADGLLPPGTHPASWAEIVGRLGDTTHRDELLAGLRAALENLRAAGCQRAYLDGSFVTGKEVPNDYDMCWDMDGVEVALLDPVLRDVRPPRAAQQAKYRGDILPNMVEGNSGMPFVDFFQHDKVTGRAKGIIAIDLGELAK